MGSRSPSASQELIEDLLARSVFPEPGTAVVCAVSGGADSLALLVLACAAKLDVEAVHVDHGLRPTSAAEADIVASAAERFGARFRSEAVNVADGPNLEARCRHARRAVLGEGALTGHTADDQAETVLLNLLRGAGLSGLAGMSVTPTHPILGLRRAETHALCASLGLGPVVDESNTDPRFQRNRVRHELLPLAADIAERDIVPLLLRTSGRARSAAEFIDGMAEDLDPTDTNALAAAPHEVTTAALREWLRDENGHPPSEAEVERALAVVRHEVVACELRGGRRLARTGGRLRLEPAATR